MQRSLPSFHLKTQCSWEPASTWPRSEPPLPSIAVKPWKSVSTCSSHQHHFQLESGFIFWISWQAWWTLCHGAGCICAQLQLHLLYHYRARKDVITKLVPVNDMIRSHLKWWLSRQNLLYGTSVTLTTDALESGWGAHLDDISLAGTWSPA